MKRRPLLLAIWTLICGAVLFICILDSEPDILDINGGSRDSNKQRTYFELEVDSPLSVKAVSAYPFSLARKCGDENAFLSTDLSSVAPLEWPSNGYHVVQGDLPAGTWQICKRGNVEFRFTSNQPAKVTLREDGSKAGILVALVAVLYLIGAMAIFCL